jgi:SPP1 gp7 family putative phage head morphogenesis protein
MVVELEHGVENPQTNVTNSDPLTTAKIVLAHLNEMPDYYTKLRVMEQKKLDVAIKKYITIEKKMGEEALESVRDYIREHITASMEFLIRGILRKLRKEKHRIPDDPEMVVRTELNRVQNEETLDYAKEHDLKLEWVTFKRSCPLCAQMDGKIVEAGKNFKHPETGETLKNPPLHCNCRCSLVERED